MIKRFNAWYDGLQEPFRFLFFMGLMCISVFPLHLGVSIGEPKLMLVGLVTTMIVVYIAAMRATNMGGKHNLFAKVLMGLLTVIVLAVAVLVFF